VAFLTREPQAAARRGDLDIRPRNTGQRPVLTVRRDRDDDRAAQGALEAELGHPAGREGFDDDAGGRREPGEDRATVRRREIAGDAALVHVRGEPRDRTLAVLHVADEWRLQPVRLATGRLDLHDIGAEVREDAAAHRSGQVREIQDPAAAEKRVCPLPIGSADGDPGLRGVGPSGRTGTGSRPSRA